MIKSMTGYGGASGEAGGILVTAEIRSVNNRHLDTSVRLPRSCLFAEDAVRGAVREHLSRGKADVFLTVDTTAAEEILIEINRPLAAAYVRAAEEAAETWGIGNDLTASRLLRMPEVITTRRGETGQEAVLTAVGTVLDQALARFDAMRAAEGEKLAADIRGKLAAIEDMVTQVEARSPETVAEYRRRLYDRMREVLSETGVDEARVLQEAAVYADKVAVDEETVRLRSHIAQYRQTLAAGSPAGRRLDFLTQEMNREINTIGSKCADGEIAAVVIEMKAELEKIREQIQNIE